MNAVSKTVFYAKCNAEKLTQKWNWGVVNETMLRDWVHFGKPILDEGELADLGGESI